MSSLNRRSLIQTALGASLGTFWTRPPHPSAVAEPSFGQLPVGFFNVKDFGAKGDGSTDDSGAFQGAIAAAGQVKGVVAVPASTSTYIVGSSLNLSPNTRIEGAGGQSPTVRLRGAETLFNFLGDSEAAGLNMSLTHLTLESGSNGNGVAVRVRNFSGLFLRHVNIDHFRIGLWADWGIGVHLYGCGLIRNGKGLQVGGTGDPGGIRGGGRHADAFMDTVVVEACGFAQNGLDINDMGSSHSLGAIAIRDSSFFEAYTSPVPEKRAYIRIANRKGISVSGNWFEGGQSGRTCIYLGDHDHDGNRTGMCRGAAIFGNDLLQTGATDTIGIDVANCDGATIFGNCFEFATGNSPIRLADGISVDTVGQNSYATYPDRSGYTNPIARGLR